VSEYAPDSDKKEPLKPKRVRIDWLTFEKPTIIRKQPFKNRKWEKFVEYSKKINYQRSSICYQYKKKPIGYINWLK
jgi:hypothetical protein